MNTTSITTLGALIAIAAVASPALGEDVGMLTNLGQPGFYGRIELGHDAPQPRVYFAQPRLVERVAVFEDPIYLRVRPGEGRDWRLHCQQYDACGRYVYFVNDHWYNTVYMPHYRDRGNAEVPTYEDGRFESARREDDHRDDHRNDDHRGDPGDRN